MAKCLVCHLTILEVFNHLHPQTSLEHIVLVVLGAALDPFGVLHEAPDTLHVPLTLIPQLQVWTHQAILECQYHQSLHFPIEGKREWLCTAKLAKLLVDFLDDNNIGLLEMFQILFLILLRILSEGGHKVLALVGLLEGIPMWQSKSILFDIGELFDQLHQMLEQDHHYPLKGLLWQGNVSVVLD